MDTRQLLEHQRLLLLLTVVLVELPAAAQLRIYETNVLVETVAGSGFAGHVDGVGTQTMFDHPVGITVDRMTNVFIWDGNNRRIRKIIPDGTVSTFAGSGRQAIEDGVGTNASFYVQFPYEADMVAGSDGTLYFANLGYVRRISPQGVVTTFDGSSGLSQSLGLAIDSDDNLLIADEGNCRIKKISSSGIVSTVAGSGNCATVDGVGIFSSFSHPHGIAVDTVGNIYVGERGSVVIRRISPDGTVRTIAGQIGQGGERDGLGTNATLGGLLRLACDSLGNVYLGSGNLIRKLSPEGMVTTLAGGSGSLYADGEGSLARFFGSDALTIDGAGRLWVADRYNQRIRRISYSPIPTTGFGIGMYAGLSVTGAIGRSYRIEFVDALRHTNDWMAATILTLTNSPTIWFDLDSPNRQKRFYRAVLVP